MSYYRCMFAFYKLGQVVPFRYIVTVERMDILTDGFWVDEDMKPAAASDTKYWIPPAQILTIHKVDESELPEKHARVD